MTHFKDCIVGKSIVNFNIREWCKLLLVLCFHLNYSIWYTKLYAKVLESLLRGNRKMSNEYLCVNTHKIWFKIKSLVIIWIQNTENGIWTTFFSLDDLWVVSLLFILRFFYVQTLKGFFISFCCAFSGKDKCHLLNKMTGNPMQNKKRKSCIETHTILDGLPTHLCKL